MECLAWNSEWAYISLYRALHISVSRTPTETQVLLLGWDLEGMEERVRLANTQRLQVTGLRYH